VISIGRAELTQSIIKWVRDNRQSNTLLDTAVNEDTNLVTAGLLDSFGFVDLVSFLEGRYGIRINLLDSDPSEFTVVRGLCDIALSGSNGGAGHAIDIELAAGSGRLAD
jgi:acyl carrier protein